MVNRKRKCRANLPIRNEIHKSEKIHTRSTNKETSKKIFYLKFKKKKKMDNLDDYIIMEDEIDDEDNEISGKN